MERVNCLGPQFTFFRGVCALLVNLRPCTDQASVFILTIVIYTYDSLLKSYNLFYIPLDEVVVHPFNSRNFQMGEPCVGPRSLIHLVVSFSFFMGFTLRLFVAAMTQHRKNSMTKTTIASCNRIIHVTSSFIWILGPALELSTKHLFS